MPTPSTEGEEKQLEGLASQSGLRVWLACALFLLVPTVIILVVKYILAL